MISLAVFLYRAVAWKGRSSWLDKAEHAGVDAENVGAVHGVRIVRRVVLQIRRIAENYLLYLDMPVASVLVSPSKDVHLAVQVRSRPDPHEERFVLALTTAPDHDLDLIPAFLTHFDFCFHPHPPG